MHKLFIKRFMTLMTAFLLFSSVGFSQLFDSDFLRAAPDDAVKFLQTYITPWTNAFGAGLNGSWYNSAKPHKLGGFDITLGINVGVVPSSDKTFDISSLGLSSSLSGSGSTPTIAGPKDGGQTMTYSQGGVTLATFETPPGTNWKFVPAPTVNIGIGLPLGTELKARFMPKISIGDGDVGLWGIGLMHSIMQYIPGNKLLPLDVSLFAGYTRLKGNIGLDLPPDPSFSQNFSTINPSTAFSDQGLSTTISALNISAIASVNLPVISFYGGLGYSKTSTLAELKGNFPTPQLITPGAGVPYVEYNDSGVITGDEFPKIDINSFSGLRANIGFRIKLAIVTIHADYTRANYNVLSTGLGLSFR
jgi:hypothetical protein